LFDAAIFSLGTASGTAEDGFLSRGLDVILNALNPPTAGRDGGGIGKIGPAGADGINLLDETPLISFWILSNCLSAFHIDEWLSKPFPDKSVAELLVLFCLANIRCLC
jgi:hypothetical protein